MKTQLTIEKEGVEHKIQCEIIDKKIWFKLNDQIHSYDILSLTESAARKSNTTNKSADRILAPMPGRVTKIFVVEKQSVQKGDALLVMEAMKMEYTLKADLPGQIEKILAKVGDQATLGQLLMQLKIETSGVA